MLCSGLKYRLVGEPREKELPERGILWAMEVIEGLLEVYTRGRRR